MCVCACNSVGRRTPSYDGTIRRKSTGSGGRGFKSHQAHTILKYAGDLRTKVVIQCMGVTAYFNMVDDQLIVFAPIA